MFLNHRNFQSAVIIAGEKQTTKQNAFCILKGYFHGFSRLLFSIISKWHITPVLLHRKHRPFLFAVSRKAIVVYSCIYAVTIPCSICAGIANRKVYDGLIVFLFDIEFSKGFSKTPSSVDTIFVKIIGLRRFPNTNNYTSKHFKQKGLNFLDRS